MTDGIELTVLMPCLNEGETIGGCIEEAKAFIEKSKIVAEILVADNGSTDDSRRIAGQCGARVVEVPQRGYGSALMGGIRAARGRYVIMGDCDGSYDFSDLGLIVEKLREGYALVIGNRFCGGIEKGAMPFCHRYLGVPFLSWLAGRRYHVKAGDFHCGLRGFERRRLLALGLSSSGMEFATEMIGRFALAGEAICEVPVKLRQDKRVCTRSHLRTFSDGVRHLRLIFFGK